MKTLVVYYSRTGNTKKVAEAVTKALGADVEEIVDTKNRRGLLGYLGAGKDASLKKKTPIQPAKKSPAGYDLVVIGTPVWAFTMASPVRTWISEHAGEVKSAAFFCTMGGSGDKRTFKAMEELFAKTPKAVLALIEKDIRKNLHLEAVAAFATTLRGE